MNVFKAVVISVIILVILSGCANYEVGEGVNHVPDIDNDYFLINTSEVTYYRQNGYRNDVYVLYYKEDSFLQINKEYVTHLMDSVTVEQSGGIDFTAHFEGSSLSPAFDFGLSYTYFKMRSRDPNTIVDGLFNKEHEVYVVRIRRGKRAG